VFATDRCTVARSARGLARARAAFALCLLTVSLSLGAAACAEAASFTWTGAAAASEEDWSAPANWEGAAPAAGSEVESLVFPRLTSAACAIEPSHHPCYLGVNDASGLTAESLQIDDGDSYLMRGDELTLGKRGLSASPASGSSGLAGDYLELPLHLSASQTWTVEGRSGGALAENGILLENALTGAASELTVDLRNASALILANETEVGPTTIAGAEAAVTPLENGLVILEGRLNSGDDQPLSLRDVALAGTGEVGPLETHDALIDVGSGEEVAGRLEASNVELDSESIVGFEVSGADSAQHGYSQLISRGPVQLNEAYAGLFVHPPEGGGACPVLKPGETFTLVSTTGSLSGSFANAPEGGAEIPIAFSRACPRTQTMRIVYDRTGATKTVTATIEAAAEEQEEREREAREHVALVVTATEPPPAPVLLQNAVLGQHDAVEGSPLATLVGTSLTVGRTGALAVKVACPASVHSCTGTVTIHSLGVVPATLARGAHRKAAILTLATATYTVAGGRAKVLAMRLTRRALDLLRRRRVLRARATVVARDPAGKSDSTQVNVLLREREVKRGG
jgi:hypothetical protein